MGGGGAWWGKAYGREEELEWKRDRKKLEKELGLRSKKKTEGGRG